MKRCSCWRQLDGAKQSVPPFVLSYSECFSLAVAALSEEFCRKDLPSVASASCLPPLLTSAAEFSHQIHVSAFSC